MPTPRRLKFQINIPNRDTPQDEPTVSVIVDPALSSKPSLEDCQCSLNELFDQVAESYKHDKSALHRFSYYLLLHAKEFAQDEVYSEEGAGTALEVKE